MFPWQLETIHPLFVHFPIALLSTAWVSDILGTLTHRDSLHYAGWWCQVFGIISIVFTIMTGIFADIIVGHMTEPFPLFQTHGVIQITVSVLFTILFIWRLNRRSKLPEKPLLFLYYLLWGLAVLILFYGAHLGAKLAGRI